MIIQCQGCAAKYYLPEHKVPSHPLKVRCPKCRAVFLLSPRTERAPAAAVVGERGAQRETPRTPDVALPIPTVPAVADLAAATPEPTAPAAPRARGGQSKDDRAKRLARVLVSDILWYNRNKRDVALREGTLLTTLGEEIKKSWELYKEKVGAETAQSTNYFKEALNEILADGQEVF